MRSEPHTILVYSHRDDVRESIITAIGRRPAADIGRVSYIEAARVADVIAQVDAGTVDLAVLDGEAQPTGGMGLARQLRDEVAECPPILVTARRRDDRWLATWSRADAVLVHPLDPIATADTVAELLRGRNLPAPTELRGQGAAQ
ncbi:hypothetical protein [Haloechinothrix sp. LS1_15]|uniref:hypothetical protein n=1 Tax=Haloechinothrix sp. LS1_15 TaxID=2652248 RepID=UPI00294AE1DD|nr:hypothetical protein [Haloechinothrix sp. LS1_15]